MQLLQDKGEEAIIEARIVSVADSSRRQGHKATRRSSTCGVERYSEGAGPQCPRTSFAKRSCVSFERISSRYGTHGKMRSPVLRMALEEMVSDDRSMLGVSLRLGQKAAGSD